MKIMWIFWGRGCSRGVVGRNVGCIPKNVDGMVTAGASMWPILNSASEEKQSSIRILFEALDDGSCLDGRICLMTSCLPRKSLSTF
ncbi:Uncharacterized protein HZ326_31886, partial [Fusarium oxysporum f. sp. albedinis]